MCLALWDSSNIALELQDGIVTGSYVRGINLIAEVSAASALDYYLFNGHGDVVQLASANGTVTKSYDYDAFGVERNPDANDTNPWRYCGEYYDTESGTYYLRARYYDPVLGRFLSEDTHWNPHNMIYGDDPLLLNEYTYKPSVIVIMQSGNKYSYCVANPKKYRDPSGYSTMENAIKAGQTSAGQMADYLPWVIPIVKAITATPAWFLAGIGAVGLYGEIANMLSALDANNGIIKDFVDAQTTLHLDEEPGTHSVYVIRDIRFGENQNKVVYVGRTSNFKARQDAHQKYVDAKTGVVNYPEKEYSMQIVMTGLTLDDARHLEQGLICTYVLSALGGVLNNKINSIALKNMNTNGC